MKRCTVIFAVTLFAFLAGSAYVWWSMGIGRVLTGDLTASFTHDLYRYVEQTGRLPVDWHDFEQWEHQRGKKVRWRVQDIDARFVLLPRPYEISNGIPRYIKVVDPRIVGMEAFINKAIESAFRARELTNRTANHTSQARSLRVEPER